MYVNIHMEYRFIEPSPLIVPRTIFNRNSPVEPMPCLQPDEDSVSLEDYRQAELEAIISSTRQLVLIVGSAGAGKSHLIRILCSEHGATKADVNIKGNGEMVILDEAIRSLHSFSGGASTFFNHTRNFRKIVLADGGSVGTPMQNLVTLQEMLFEIDKGDYEAVHMFLKPLNIRQSLQLIFSEVAVLRERHSDISRSFTSDQWQDFLNRIPIERRLPRLLQSMVKLAHMRTSGGVRALDPRSNSFVAEDFEEIHTPINELVALRDALANWMESCGV